MISRLKIFINTEVDPTLFLLCINDIFVIHIGGKLISIVDDSWIVFSDMSYNYDAVA